MSANELQVQATPGTTVDGNFRPARGDTTGRTIVATEAAAPLAVTMSEPVGSITWTKTTVTMTGASAQLLAANAARKGLIVINRTGNAQVDVDIAGGTVAANTGIPLLATGSLTLTGNDTPVSAITAIGTNTQIVNVYEGT